MINKNRILKTLAASLTALLGLVVLLLAQDVVTTEASSSRSPATTTPIPTAEPTPDYYWSHEVVNLTFSHPGTSGEYWGDEVTAPGYDDVEAVYFEFIKRCPSANNHWAKSAWENEGGSWAQVEESQTCDTLYKLWWDQGGGQSYADAKSEITSRFGAVGDTAVSQTNASTATEYRVGTGAGTNGDAGYTSELNVYYLHHGTDGACSDDIELSSESFSDGTIDATLEAGVSESLADGGNYGVEISGGPWDDGSVDRYDAAYSWDGMTWEILDGRSADVYCTEDLETGGQMYYLEAQSTTLYLRVNDVEGEFTDNDNDLDYEIFGVVGEGETGCGAYYTIGELVFDESWDASFDSIYDPGQKAWPSLTGVYFENYDIYRILIPHTWQDGIWYNSTAQIKPATGGSWQDLQTHPQTVCVEDHDSSVLDEPGWMAYYFMSPEDFTTYQIRSEDLDNELIESSWDNNSGGFQVQIYAATYQPPVSSCATALNQGALIQHVETSANAQNGIVIPDPSYMVMEGEIPGLLVGSEYVLADAPNWEGYLTTGGDRQFVWQISEDRTSWQDIDDFADCVEIVDNNLSKYYFEATAEQLYIRAQDLDSDGSWADQSGVVSLNLYYANDLRLADEDGSCPSLVLGDSVLSGSVGSSQINGEILPDVMTPGQLYAIQLTTPAWSDDGEDQKTAEIKLVGESSWSSFTEWEGAFCSETDGLGWPTDWIQAADARYMIRADDTVLDNSGWVNYTIYEASWDDEPIYPSCESSFSPLQFVDYPVEDSSIEANKQYGVAFQEFVLNPGVYKITTSGGPWYETSSFLTERYGLEISFENGANNTWQYIDEAVDCVVPLSDGVHFRYYFTIPETSTATNLVRLRVHNSGLLWLDNYGSIDYTAQYYTNGVDPSVAWSPGYDGDQFFQSGGCYLVCVRPSSSINVPAWLEYFRCQLVRRMSFCDYHVVRLMQMRDLFYNREPFGSLQELGAAFGLVRAQTEQYQWHDDIGGDDPPEINYPDNFIFASEDGGGADIPLVGEDSPWGSGQIDILGEGETFDTTCQNQLADSLGSRLGQPVCFAFNVIDSLGLSSWFQLFWDLIMIGAAGMYFQNRWLKPMSS